MACMQSPVGIRSITSRDRMPRRRVYCAEWCLGPDQAEREALTRLQAELAERCSLLELKARMLEESSGQLLEGEYSDESLSPPFSPSSDMPLDGKLGGGAFSGSPGGFRQTEVDEHTDQPAVQ